ncbi:Zinc finger, MIZ-type [Cinara cedri]|uniref:Zinc finger, MIZ-type n=1 Tax=Cinara cedri TaxID=506608 RepID=A0A5E4M9Y6_9HEMI|nr:Zinc finger, MIZ-type [Cinara cedri]
MSNESIEVPSQPDIELDIIGILETAIKARNKITCSKDILLPSALDETEFKDILYNMDKNKPIIAQSRLSKHVQDNKQSVRSLIDNISKLKHSSELKMNFAINDEIYEDDELNQAMSQMFNECLNDNSVVDDAEDDLKNYMILIQQTCEFNRGVESLFSCDKKLLQKHVKKDLSISAMMNLITIQKYNKSSAELENFTTVQTEIIDPFTRKLITKPVTNKQCNHVYDEESIDLMFKNKLFVCCPHIDLRKKISYSMKIFSI